MPYSRVATSTDDDDHGVAVPPPPSRPPPSRSFVAQQRGATELPPPSRPPPPSVPRPAPATSSQPQPAAAAVAGSTPIAPPSKPRPSPRVVEQLRQSSGGEPVAPPSRPPPSRAFVAEQRESSSGAARPSAASFPAPPSEGLLQPFHAQVGDSIPLSALEAVSNSMIVEARKKFHQHKFEEALHGFQYCLAVAEKTTRSGKGPKIAEYGAMLHNIASCLHCLGDFATAKTYYERALAAFDGPAPSRISYLLYGDVDRKRCEFVRERLVDIEHGRKPDLDKYLDGYGNRRDVTPELASDTPTPRMPPTVDPWGTSLGTRVIAGA